MTFLALDFEQIAPSGGAVVVPLVVPGEPKPVAVVVDRPALEGLSVPPRQARPFEDGAVGSGLFRTFASTPLTDETIATWFARYGRLGVPAVSGRLSNGRETRGERVDAWHAAQEAFRWPLALWDALREGQLPASWTGLPAKNQRFFTLETGWRTLNAGVSIELDRHAVRVMLDQVAERSAALRIGPATLLGALWLQFALAIDGNREYRSCTTCGRFYELDPAVARTNRLYCTDACRMKAYRDRKGRGN